MFTLSAFSQAADSSIVDISRLFLDSYNKHENVAHYCTSEITFVYSSYDRCYGTYMGGLKSLNAAFLLDTLVVTIINDGRGWSYCKEPEIKTQKIYLPAFAIYWEHYFLADADFENHRVIMSNGSSEEFSLYFEKVNGVYLIDKIVYSSIDPG